MIKTLEITNPPFASFPGVAVLLGILYSKPNFELWLCNNFIQVVAVKDLDWKGTYFGHFYDDMRNNDIPPQMFCPFLKTEIISRKSFLFKTQNISECFQQLINENHYIYTYLNNFYIKSSQWYRKSKIQHPTFIYGYNDNEFLIADYYSNMYTHSVIEKNDLIDSFWDMSEEWERPAGKDANNVKLFKYTPYNYKYNKDLTKLFLNDYLNCKDSFNKYPYQEFLREHKIKYGLDYYTALAEMIGSGIEFINLTAFHVIYDHKIAMKERLQVLYKNVFIRENSFIKAYGWCEELVNETLQLRNMTMKYINAPSDLLRIRINEKIDNIRTSDKDFVTFLLSAI